MPRRIWYWRIQRPRACHDTYWLSITLPGDSAKCDEYGASADALFSPHRKRWMPGKQRGLQKKVTGRLAARYVIWLMTRSGIWDQYHRDSRCDDVAQRAELTSAVPPADGVEVKPPHHLTLRRWREMLDGWIRCCCRAHDDGVSDRGLPLALFCIRPLRWGHYRSLYYISWKQPLKSPIILSPLETAFTRRARVLLCFRAKRIKPKAACGRGLELLLRMYYFERRH